MSEVILDAFLDSLKILAVVVVFQFIIAFIEPKLSDKIKLNGNLAPLIGVSISLLPQCGFSIVATDLYQKRHLTLGTLIGVYLATSDEALPIFLGTPEKALHVLPLIALKFALGLLFGYLIDLVMTKSRKKVEHHVKHCDEQYKIRLTECKKARPKHRTSPFAHEAGHCLCGAWVIAVKENSRRRRTRAQYPKKQEEKDFTHSLGALPLL